MDFTAQQLYGQAPVPGSHVAAPTAGMASDDIASGVRGLVDPRNPLVWFGGLLAVTVGLIGVSGSVRLGRAKLAASAGTT